MELGLSLDRRLSLTGLLIVLFAIWRITHLLWGEDGPGDVFARLRKLAGNGFFAHLLDCFYCLSLWVALPLAWAIGRDWLERLVLWFGLSGGAILLERVTEHNSRPAVPQWIESSPPLARCSPSLAATSSSSRCGSATSSIALSTNCRITTSRTTRSQSPCSTAHVGGRPLGQEVGHRRLPP